MPKSDVDIKCDRAKKLPGPGAYDLPSTLQVAGGKFNDAVVPTDTEIRMKRAKKLPGPGQYSLPTTLKSSGGGFQARFCLLQYESFPMNKQ